MSKLLEIVEKYKKLVIIGSIVVGVLFQLGGIYAGYKVYDKFEQLDRSERAAKAKIKELRITQGLIVLILRVQAKRIKRLEKHGSN